MTAASPAISALRHASVTISSEPVLESKAHSHSVVEIALFGPARLPGETPGRIAPVQSIERDAADIRHLHDAGRDGLGFLAVTERERHVTGIAVVAREAQRVAETPVQIRRLRGRQRIADANERQVFL